MTARIRAHPLGETVAEQRENFERLALGDASDTAAPDAERRPHDIDHAAPGSGRAGSIVYFHGGGYAFGSPHTHERIAEGLAERTGERVVIPRYPLAPEHPWPAQLNAAIAAVDEIDGPIVLAGDSAGAHLALVTSLALSHRGRSPSGLVLFSPNTDRSGLSTTRERNEDSDPMVDDDGDRELARQCFGDYDPADPQVSPVLDDLSLLPPLYVEVGTDEVLLGDSLILADRARQVGGSVTLHVERNGLHMGQLWSPWWPTANASLDRAAAFATLIIRAGRTREH